MKETNTCRGSSTGSQKRAARLTTGLSLLFCAILLTGCGQGIHPNPAEKPCHIDASLTVCKAPPMFQPPASQADVAAALLHLDAAWEDCSKKLSRIPGVIAASCWQ